LAFERDFSLTAVIAILPYFSRTLPEAQRDGAMIRPSDTVIAKDSMRKMLVIGLNQEEGKVVMWCEWTDPAGRKQCERFPESDLIKLQS
jgi:hypothetical protein